MRKSRFGVMLEGKDELHEVVSALYFGKAGRQATAGLESSLWLADADAPSADVERMPVRSTSCPVGSAHARVSFGPSHLEKN